MTTDLTPDEAAATVERLTQRPKGGVVWSPKELADRALVAGYRELRDEVAALRADLAQARAREQAVRDLADRWRAVPAITRDRVEDADELIRDLIDNVSAALAPATPQEGDNR